MDIFGLKKGEEKVLKFGESFNESSREFCHTYRCDFKPASADKQKVGSMLIDDKEVMVTVPLVEGHGAQEAVYKGSKTPACKDYILVVDNKTGEITVEKVGYHIRVKRTRVEKKSQGHRLSPYQRQSPSQLSSASGSSPNKPSPRQSPGTNRINLQKANTYQAATAPGSMPFLSFEDNKPAYKNSIMSDSSSDSDSNSGSSSSSSDSDSDSEPETPQPTNHSNGMIDNKQMNGYSNSPDILDDLNLSEED